jgi:hypothetical protein
VILITLIEKLIDDILARFPGGRGQAQPAPPPPPPLSAQEAAYNHSPTSPHYPSGHVGQGLAPENEPER